MNDKPTEQSVTDELDTEELNAIVACLNDDATLLVEHDSLGAEEIARNMVDAADAIDTLRAEIERLRTAVAIGDGVQARGWAPARRVEQLEAQLAEAQRDDERLDWLEDNWHRAPLGEWEDRYETLRAAIDAAKEQA